MGSYGINGFYLEFVDNSMVVVLGIDMSGNGNDWMLSGIIMDDQVIDMFSVNYVMLNFFDVIFIGGIYMFFDGNLKVNWSILIGQVFFCGIIMFLVFGKWYYEFYLQFELIILGGVGVYYKYYDVVGNNVQLLNFFGGFINIYEGGSVVIIIFYMLIDMFVVMIDNDVN